MLGGERTLPISNNASSAYSSNQNQSQGSSPNDMGMESQQPPMGASNQGMLCKGPVPGRASNYPNFKWAPAKLSSIKDMACSGINSKQL